MRNSVKTLIFSVIVILAIQGCSDKDGKYKYQDSSLPVEKRVEDLLGRMSVEEKVDQIRQSVPLLANNWMWCCAGVRQY